MHKTINVGVIGLGAIGNVHLDAYQAVDGKAVTAICDVLPDRVEEQGKRLNIAGRFTDYHELLKSDVDAVSICVGNALHRDVALAALNAGKHVLLEKPMAMNAGEALEIQKAGEQADCVVQVGMVRRQATEIQVVRSMVERGLFGEIYHMRAVMIRRRGIPGLGGWFTTRAQSGGGPMIDLGVHWFDAAMYVSGLWNPTHVSAKTYAKFGRDMHAYRYTGMWAGPPKFDGVFDVEDYSTGLIRFGDQATLSFEIAWAANAKEESYIELLGDRAGVRIFDGEPLRIWTEHDDRPADILPKVADAGNPFESQVRKFLAACRGDAPPAATAAQGVTIMKTIDAVYASSDQNREVAIT